MSRFPVPDILPALGERFSPKAFAEQAVPDAALKTLFRAFSWAPSCYNDQPWRLIVGQRDAADDTTWKKLLALCAERNRQWARTAPVLMLSVAVSRYRHNGEPNRFAEHDVGLAMGNLLAQATALGLVAHQVGGYDDESAVQAFALPEFCRPMAVVALGYHGDPATLPKGVAERAPTDRERLPLSEIVFGEHFGAPFMDFTD
jgi:nitroreductase